MSDTPDQPASSRFRDSLLGRRLKVLALLVVLAVAVLYGTIWFQESGLRTASGLLEDGQAEQAYQVLEQWQSSYGETDASQALKARCLIELGRHAEGVQLFETVGAATTEEFYAWARGLLHLEQWGQALPVLQRVQAERPDDPDILHEIAAAQAKLGMLQDALKTVEQFEAKTDQLHRALLLKGTILQQLGNKQQAASAWDQIEKYDPEFSDLQISAHDFLVQMGSLQLELGNPERAVTILALALSQRESAEAHFQSGLAADQTGHPEQAAEHWQRTLELDAHHLNARESLARQAIASGNSTRAMELLLPVVEFGQPRSATTYLLQRAATLSGDEESAERWRVMTEELRKSEQIDAAISQLLRESPESYWGQIVRSYDFARSGNLGQAQAILQAVPITDEEHPFVAQLRRSLAENQPLPSLEELPISSF